jgi:hypothetical protein
MEGNLAELADARKPQELADMIRHLRRWEQGLPHESATNRDIAPFDKLASFPRWRTETAGLPAIADKLELFDRFGTREDEIEPSRGRFRTSLMRSPRPARWPPTPRAVRDARYINCSPWAMSVAAPAIERARQTPTTPTTRS